MAQEMSSVSWAFFCDVAAARLTCWCWGSLSPPLVVVVIVCIAYYKLFLLVEYKDNIKKNILWS